MQKQDVGVKAASCFVVAGAFHEIAHFALGDISPIALMELAIWASRFIVMCDTLYCFASRVAVLE